jgi:hypothetical protein
MILGPSMPGAKSLSHTYSLHSPWCPLPLPLTDPTDVQAGLPLSCALLIARLARATATATSSAFAVVPYSYWQSIIKHQHTPYRWSAFPTRIYRGSRITNPVDPACSRARGCLTILEGFCPLTRARSCIGATERGVRPRRFRRTPKKRLANSSIARHCRRSHHLYLRWLSPSSLSMAACRQWLPCPVASNCCCPPIISVSAAS